MQTELNYTHVVDYIVVGAGSAGCAVAARLSDRPDVSVMLIEGGGEDRNPWFHIPVGFAKLYAKPDYNWIYQTEPEPHLNNTPGMLPQGKVLGGGSSVNGMVYIRGQREDYDHWRQLGNVGWDFDSVLPYFRRMEDQQRGADFYHGVGGPLHVVDPAETNPLCDAFIAAAEQAGIPYNHDFNGPVQEGVGYYQTTTHNGRRWSTADAYLRPIRHRKNLHVETNAAAERIVFEGMRAAGLEYTKDGVTRIARARGEIIVSSGGLGSPLLLQRSGIGPGDLLQAAGIPVLSDMQGVGRNLANHFHGWLNYRVKQKVTLNDAAGTLLGRVAMALRYAVFRSGPMTMGPAVIGAFLRTDPRLASPDIQFHVAPFSMNRKTGALDSFPGMTTCVCQLRPESRGVVEVRGRKLADAAKVQFNYMSTELDQQTIVKGIKILRDVMSRPALAPFIAGDLDFDPKHESDADILAYARQRKGTAHHVASTCKMGTDERAVVDPRLRVHGIDGLRVADGSIMPVLVSGNTNAPIIMIGEKCADMVLEDARAG